MVNSYRHVLEELYRNPVAIPPPCWNNRTKLNPDSLIACVIDGAANYQSAGNNGKKVNIWCFCHRLSLFVKDILKKDDFYSLTKKCKKIASHVNKSIKASSELKRFAGITIKSPASTRWNSYYSTFKDVKAAKKFWRQILEKKPELNVSPIEWKLLDSILLILRPISSILRSLEGEKTPTINLVMPGIFNIVDEWKDKGIYSRDLFLYSSRFGEFFQNMDISILLILNHF